MKLSLLVAALVLVLAAAEGVLRLLGMLDPITYRHDPVYGYEPKPNQSANRLGVKIFSNDIGLRDDEPRAALMRGGRRLLVLGDSVTYGGSRTRQPDLFTEVLERTLQAGSHRIKVLNAGVNGYSVSQMVHRGQRLVEETDPHYLILYVVRGDFRRSPVQYLADGNYIYPTRKPRSALAALMLLSVNHINKRTPIFDHMPRWLAHLWDMPHNHVPAYDKSRIVETHLAALDNFLRTTWEGQGRSRRHVLVFFSPYATDLQADLPAPNADLVAALEALGVQAYDLQPNFRTVIAGSGAEVGDYYWDEVHFIEKGHALAAEIVYQYLVREWLADGEAPQRRDAGS
jgi:lysophospholipase L1-like esterase